MAINMERYFSKIHNRSATILVGLALAASLVPSLLMLPFADPPDLRSGQLSALGEAFPFVVVLLMPALETLLCQALPALLIDIFSVPARLRIIAITVPFALGHIIPGSLIPSLINGISGGVILGVCYLVCERKSAGYAILVTTLVHAAHNALALALGN